MIPDRYNTRNLKRALQNPSLFTDEIARLNLSHRLYDWARRKSNKAYLSLNYDRPIRIMDEDWDNLILLDACRYDAFRQVNDIEGTLSKVVSTNSQTCEFTKENLAGKTFHDTVYITANGYGWEQIDTDGIFHDVIKTYAAERGTLPEELWSQGSPSAVSQVFFDNYEEYTDKRILVHFVQPHIPYLGEYADELRSGLRDSEGIVTRWGKITGQSADMNDPEIIRDLTVAAESNLITQDDLWRIYLENLELVMAEVRKIVETIEGKTVITADHGELLGSPTSVLPAREKYGHPSGRYIPELRVVPWFVVENGERRSIVSEPPVATEEASDDAVKQNLRSLGYVE